MEGLADYNFITSHVSDVDEEELRQQFFLPSLFVSLSLGRAQSLSAGREAISVTTFHVQF